MHRFYVETRLHGSEGVIRLGREESVHAARVLRLKPGEAVELLDGESLYRAVLTLVDEQGVEARVLEALPSPEAAVRMTLWQGLPKGDKLEWVVQKATELGVWDIWPVEMERSVSKAEKGDKEEKKRARLQRIAMEAAKQSGRAHVPVIWETCGFSQALGRLGTGQQAEGTAFDLVIVAWEESEGRLLSEAVRSAFKPEEWASVGGNPLWGGGGIPRILLVIGPEGGIGLKEWERLQALGGICVTLGRRILRTETAGLCALAVILTALGEM